MTRKFGAVLDDERFDVNEDWTEDETDSEDLSPYNPHIGMVPDLSPADYVQALRDKLLADGQWAGSDPKKNQAAVTRLKIQEAPWNALYWARENRDDKDVKGRINDITASVKAGVMMVDEWNHIWTGLGGWMKKSMKQQLEQRQVYEMAHQYPRTRGLWTRLNSVYARQLLVGGTGLRTDKIDHPFEWMVKAWSWEGKSSLAKLSETRTV